MLANRGTIRPKAKAPVCRNTFGKAVAHPTDERGFFTPKFWGLVRLHRPRMVCGGMGLPVRMAAWLFPCYEHPAHLLRVVARQVASKSRKGATMSASKGHTAPMPKAAPAIPTTSDIMAAALVDVLYAAELAALLRDGDSLSMPEIKALAAGATALADSAAQHLADHLNQGGTV